MGPAPNKIRAGRATTLTLIQKQNNHNHAVPYNLVDVQRKVQSANGKRINELHAFFQGFTSRIGDYYTAMVEVINSFGSSNHFSRYIDKAIEILSTRSVIINGVFRGTIDIDESVQKYGCYPLERAKRIYQKHCETFPGDTANKRRLDSITAVLEELNDKGLCKTIAQQHEEKLRQEGIHPVDEMTTSSLGGKKRYTVNKQTKKRRSNKRPSTRRRRRKNIRK
jgi:hypothetical protein